MVFNISESDARAFFTEEEMRQIFQEVGAEKIAKNAIHELTDQLCEIGISISKIAQTFYDRENDNLTAEHLLRAARRFSNMHLPVIHNIWIISENGTCLFSESYSGLQFPDTIFSGLLLGIANMCEEVSGRKLERLNLGDMAINIRSVDPILVAIVSDNVGEAVDLLVKQIGERFIEIYGHRLQETAVDINVFQSFDRVVKDIIRSWGISLPSEVTGEGVQRLLDPELIRESVISAAQRRDLEIAMETLRKLPLFTPAEEDDWDKLISLRERIDAPRADRKRATDLINEIFESTEQLRSEMRAAQAKDDLDDDGEEL